MKRFILLLVISVANQTIGGEFFNVNTTNYYISYPLIKNYHEAVRFCTINGMYLVSIHTQESHNALMEVIRKWNSSYPTATHFWTSGTSLGHHDKEFYWAETGFPVTFSNWMSGAPSSADRKCILLHGGPIYTYRWYDQLCNLQNQFICEDKINLPHTLKDFNNNVKFIN